MAVRLTTVRGTVAAVATVAALVAGCSAGPAPAPTPTGSGSPGPVPTPSAPLGERPLATGESASLPSGTEGTLTLTVQDIDVVESCPGRGVPTAEPELGHFVVLDVTVSSDGTEEPVHLPPGAFHLADTSGALQRVSTTDASWSCFEDAELLPAFVPAGQTVTGKVVLDAASPHGQVRYPAGEETLVWAY
ncbi:hypothetical protein ATJ97_1202 [Georgenia soli]|uniref:DUF4352 domain-containing protein n=1 Tax=Georgenia soli TaxID=638953 RepID=A0A2A9EJD9_9MICO|nr:hypothetical protein [Georgenia soli]PFG38716.1 hypothetical protein ATJ97_1202 [Georgenia soli]